MFDLHLISGLSGSGKTHLGKYIAEKEGMVFIDQDAFYKAVKPRVGLSNGMTVSNWDTVEAIDWNALNRAVLKELQYNDVVLVGFALWSEYLETLNNYVASHVRLVYGHDEINKCKEARIQAKGGKGLDPVRDALVVNEVVRPFYKQTLKHLGPHEVINVFSGNQRKSVEELYEEWR